MNNLISIIGVAMLNIAPVIKSNNLSNYYYITNDYNTISLNLNMSYIDTYIVGDYRSAFYSFNYSYDDDQFLTLSYDTQMYNNGRSYGQNILDYSLADTTARFAFGFCYDYQTEESLTRSFNIVVYNTPYEESYYGDYDVNLSFRATWFQLETFGVSNVTEYYYEDLTSLHSDGLNQYYISDIDVFERYRNMSGATFRLDLIINNVGYHENQINESYEMGKADGYLNGYGIGYDSGLSVGYQSGYTEGMANAQNVDNSFSLIGSAFESINSFLSVHITPTITIGLLCAIPLCIGVIIFVFKVVSN